MESLYQEYLIDKGIHGETDKCYMLEGKHQVNFDTLKMVKNNSTREIQRYFQPGVWVALNSSPFQSQIHAKINRIQLDNQLTDCIFPVVLAPIPPPKTLAKTIHFKPIIEISIVERVVPHSNVKQYKYAKMLMQEFHFKVDLVFLMAIAELFTNTVDDEREAKLFKDDVNSIERPLSDLIQIQSQQQQKNFYDNLHLGPMKVHLSFSMAGVDTSVLPGILSKLVQGVGVTLTDGAIQGLGFVDGVTGCVTKPLLEPKEEVVEGFFKGLGKGTYRLKLQDETRRLRPPRYIHEDKILRAYCLDEAKGNQLLKEIDKGKYANTDNFVHCEEIVRKHEYVVVSNYRIIYVSRNDMFGSWSVQWTYLWSEIERVTSTDRGIEILLKKENKKVLGLFNSSEQQHKLIMMPLRKRREKLLEAIRAHRSTP
ncbi:hypothetical protein DOY81_013385 [Sarcophaga bullata]|nr:hypothetical protein DOY81_013385 [Sarcophaga bullata]